MNLKKRTALPAMAQVSAKVVMGLMMTAQNVKVPETAQNVTVPEQKANSMSDVGEPNEEPRVARLLDMRKEQLSLAEQAEFHLMQALWELRGSYSIEDMARWTGWSRQTIYNKWDKHGLKVKEDAKSPRDSS